MLTTLFHHLFLSSQRPRLVVIDSGRTFAHFTQDCLDANLNVNTARLAPDSGVSLPVLLNAPMLGIATPNRNYLDELEIVTRLLITGCEKAENDRIRRSERLAIRRSLLDATNEAAIAGRQCIVPHDVANAMRSNAAKESGGHRQVIAQMADGLDMFCASPAGEWFNRPGNPWPDADVTIFDIATLVDDDLADQLAITLIGLVSIISDLACDQLHPGRPTIVSINESTMTANPLLTGCVAAMTRPWKKLGCALWLNERGSLVTQVSEHLTKACVTNSPSVHASTSRPVSRDHDPVENFHGLTRQ